MTSSHTTQLFLKSPCQKFSRRQQRRKSPEPKEPVLWQRQQRKTRNGDRSSADRVRLAAEQIDCCAAGVSCRLGRVQQESEQGLPNRSELLQSLCQSSSCPSVGRRPLGWPNSRKCSFPFASPHGAVSRVDLLVQYCMPSAASDGEMTSPDADTRARASHRSAALTMATY